MRCAEMKKAFKFTVGFFLKSFIWNLSFAIKTCEWFPVSGIREYYQCLDDEICCENSNELECCSKSESTDVLGLWYFWTGIFGSLSLIVAAFLCGYLCNKKTHKKSKKQKVRPFEVLTVSNAESGQGDKSNATGPTFHAHPKPHVQTSRPPPEAPPQTRGAPSRARAPLSGPGPALPAGKGPLVNPRSTVTVGNGSSRGSSSLTPLDPAYTGGSSAEVEPPPGFFQTKKISSQAK